MLLFVPSFASSFRIFQFRFLSLIETNRLQWKERKKMLNFALVIKCAHVQRANNDMSEIDLCAKRKFINFRFKWKRWMQTREQWTIFFCSSFFLGYRSYSQWRLKRRIENCVTYSSTNRNVYVNVIECFIETIESEKYRVIIWFSVCLFALNANGIESACWIDSHSKLKIG